LRGATQLIAFVLWCTATTD